MSALSECMTKTSCSTRSNGTSSLLTVLRGRMLMICINPFHILLLRLVLLIAIVVSLCYVEHWILMDIGSMSLPSGEGCHDSNFDMLDIHTYYVD